jgi:hypothetical protein
VKVGGRLVFVGVGVRDDVGVGVGEVVSVVVLVGVIVGVGDAVGDPVGSDGSNGVAVARSGVLACFTSAVAPVIGTSLFCVGRTRAGVSVWPPKRKDPPGEETKTMTTPMRMEARSVPRAMIF